MSANTAGQQDDRLYPLPAPSPQPDVDVRSSASAVSGAKLNQVVQIVVQSRQNVAPLLVKGTQTKKLNKWFNIDSLDTDTFRDELSPWRHLDCAVNVPPLEVEIYLHVRDLTPNQTLVLLDDAGSRCDVELEDGRRRMTHGEIVLERWQMEWLPHASRRDAPELSSSYKKAVVVCRSLYTVARLLPTWNFRRRLLKSKLSGASLRIGARIRHRSTETQGGGGPRIELGRPLTARGGSETVRHEFHTVDTVSGGLRIRTSYRADCNFRVDDSEALLSSQFLQIDTQHLAVPGVPRASLPNEGTTRRSEDDIERRGPTSYGPEKSATFRIASGSSRAERRSSAIVQPFKTPSLSASPSIEANVGFRPISRTPSSASIERAVARGGSQVGRAAVLARQPSYQTTERPVPPIARRYSSSFGQRSGSFSSRRRPSTNPDGTPATGPLGSLSSRNTSSTSLERQLEVPADDDDDLSTLVSMLDERPTLKLQARREDMDDSGLLRTQQEFQRFQNLREMHDSLADSISQSALLRGDVPQRASPSVYLRKTSTGSHSSSIGGSGGGGGVSGGVGSFLASTSPLKSASPHAPHVPSKLSSSSTAPREYAGSITSMASGSGVQGTSYSSGPRSAKGARTDHYQSQQAQTQQQSSITAGQSQSRHGQEREQIGIGDQQLRQLQGQLQRQEQRKEQQHSQQSIPQEQQQQQQQQQHQQPQPQSRTDTPVDDDDLFFAMSDLHMARG